MTPQERQLIADLFDRLAALEDQPRDPDAERAIRDGIAKAPHAIYPLVQTVLVQDEALKQADAYIRDLEAALQGGADASAQPKGFLDNMRDALFGRDDARAARDEARTMREEPRGSVPSVRPGEQPMGVPPQYRSSTGAPWGGGATGASWGGGNVPPPAPQESYGRGGGGSFLGTAAAVAAGAIGGGLLLSGIRGMLGGQQQHGPFAGAFDQIAGGGSGAGGGAGGDLAREAGLQDIGRGSERAGLLGGADQDAGYDRSAGLFDTSDQNSGIDDSDIGDDFDAGSDDIDHA